MSRALHVTRSIGASLFWTLAILTACAITAAVFGMAAFLATAGAAP